VYGAVQPPTHDPAWQKGAALAHALPQAPQFCASLSTDRQTPSQTTVPTGQLQDPATHASPPPHAWSQAPQWFGSVLVRTHSSPQLVCPGAEQPQLPLRQVWLAPQRWPQLPQFSASPRTSVQDAPHACRPAPQVGASVRGPSVGASVRIPSTGASARPPSQPPPTQIGIEPSWQGTPFAHRFSSVRPQPSAVDAAARQIPSAARWLLVMSNHPRGSES
jgi:hypothetical protein